MMHNCPKALNQAFAINKMKNVFRFTRIIIQFKQSAHGKFANPCMLLPKIAGKTMTIFLNP